jgi:hypothetical protein
MLRLNNGTFTDIFQKEKTYSIALPIAIIPRLNHIEISKKVLKKLKLPNAETNQGLVCQTGVGSVGRVPARHWNE